MGQSQLVHRADILAILLSSFLQGSDKPTLLALAVAFGVDRDFQQRVELLKHQRTITLDRGQCPDCTYKWRAKQN